MAIQASLPSQNHQQTIHLLNAEEMQNLLGIRDENLRVIRDRFQAQIVARGDVITITGLMQEVSQVVSLFEEMLALHRRGERITRRDVDYLLHAAPNPSGTSVEEPFTPITIPLRSRKGMIKPKTPGQRKYIQSIAAHDIVFGIGPAGTGKTYLAVAAAVSALQTKRVRRIILARPAVEAGESLGFLPGDLQAKVDPFLRPLYDGLYDMLNPDIVQRYIEQRIVEIAPLAYMRGRTLNNSFVILDEAQNTTCEQMKMFLTRLGFDSKAVITGDVTQIDLPGGRLSGLVEVSTLLNHIDGIEFVYLSKHDIVRHHLVQRIVEAYEKNQSPGDSSLQTNSSIHNHNDRNSRSE